MAGPSGLFTQLMAKKETTYGTIVTPDHTYEYDNESMSRQPTYLESAGLHAGTLVQLGSRVVPTTRTATGAIQIEVPSKGFGFWLDLLHGLVPTIVQQSATAAWLQTHLVGTSAPNKSASVQVGKPDSGGTVRPFTYGGSMVEQMVFSCANGGALKAAITLDSQDETTATALATAAYPTNLHSFNFTQGALTLGGTPLAFISSLDDLTINPGLKVDRFFFGTNGLKNQPLPNAFTALSATLSAEFTDLATLYNQFVSGAQSALVLTFTGPLIASTFFETISFTLPAVQLRGGTPTVGGPDVLGQSIPLVGFFDGTNPPMTITYMSTDTTL